MKAGGEGGDRGRDGWVAPPLSGHEFEQALGVAVHGVAESDTTEQLNKISYDCAGDAHLMRCIVLIVKQRGVKAK